MDENNTEYKRALSIALRFISHSDRTEYEVRRRLEKEELDENFIEDVISKLLNERFLNDARYAEYYITCYRDRRSKKRIISDLKGKGIDESIIMNSFDSIVSEEPKAVYKALEKQLMKRGIEDADSMTYEDKSKIYAALFRQGFDADEINRAFRSDY